jgi:hypothetical protein
MRLTIAFVSLLGLSSISSAAFGQPAAPQPPRGATSGGASGDASASAETPESDARPRSSRSKHAFAWSLGFEYMRALGADHLGPSLQFAFKQNGHYDDDEHVWGVMPGVRARILLSEREYRLSDTFSAAALPQLQAYFGVWRRFPHVEMRLAVLAGGVLPAAGAIGNVEPLLAVRLPSDFEGFVVGSVGTFLSSEASLLWSSGVGFGRAF